MLFRLSSKLRGEKRPTAGSVYRERGGLPKSRERRLGMRSKAQGKAQQSRSKKRGCQPRDYVKEHFLSSSRAVKTSKKR
jgi:hypothetical protein